MKKEIILKGKGFILRPYRKGDEVSIAENANNKKLAKNLLNTFPSPYRLKDAKEWININLKRYKEQKYPTNFVIDIDGFAVGSIGALIVNNPMFKFEFGYWLGEKYWNKGIVSEAIKLYVEYIFKTFKNIQRIQAGVYPWNEGSKKVLEKNDFKLEGILRKFISKDGKIIDAYMFSKLRNER